MLKPLYEPKDRPMRVAVFMSGSGTNAVKLLEHERMAQLTGRPSYQVAVIVTDNASIGNNSRSIADRFMLGEPLHIDFAGFIRKSSADRKDFEQRQPYFAEVANALRRLSPPIDCIALAGFELIVTEPLLSEFPGRIVNVHPADLSITDSSGKRVFTGSNAVRDAILAGEREIRASTHLVTRGVDEGPLLLISGPVKVQLPPDTTLEELRKPENAALAKRVAKEHQAKLKEIGDWHIFPETLDLLSKGAFAVDENGVMHLESRPIPNGQRITEALRTA